MTSTTEKERFIVNVLANARPYMWRENGRAMGPDTDFIREIGKRIGVDFVFRTVPMKRSLDELKKGKAHFGVGFRSPEREKFVEYIDKTPLHWSVYRIFVKHGSPIHYRHVEDLFGKRVGKNRGFSISKNFDQAVNDQKLEVLEADSATQLITILLAGRVDAIVGNPASIRKYYRQMIHEEVIYSQAVPVSPQKGSYFLMSKKARFSDRAVLREKIEKAMLEILADGTIEKIEARYPNFVYLQESEQVASE
ncbi:MAG: transporter substrate-binding domain-containing protein [Agarilytica sp.]